MHINFDKNCNSFLTKETNVICERIINNIHSITFVLRIILETKKNRSPEKTPVGLQYSFSGFFDPLLIIRLAPREFILAEQLQAAMGIGHSVRQTVSVA